jgi:hypothetical protein
MIACNNSSVFPSSRFTPASKSAHIIQSGFVRPNHRQSK